MSERLSYKNDPLRDKSQHTCSVDVKYNNIITGAEKLKEITKYLRVPTYHPSNGQRSEKSGKNPRKKDTKTLVGAGVLSLLRYKKYNWTQ